MKSLLALPLLLAATLALPASAATRRFAIVVGHNTGAPQRLPLRYAESDAGKFARVLNELAEVSASDTYLLQGRTVLDVETAIARVADAVRQTHASLDRAVVYFYFSGHGERDAVELGKERLEHQRLESLLAATGADLRLAFIDACRSGGAVQEKGARGIPAFEVALQDELHTRGHALVTSSARDEVSLESAEVGGGFFTSHLVSGLRGAADSSGDGQITLSELYRYAHDRTITGAAGVAGTSQHPSYEMNLSGQGELVLARLERSSALLVVPEGAQRVLIRDTMRDQLIAEWISGGASTAMALPAGAYAITVITAGQSYGGRLRLDQGERRSVRLEELRKVEHAPVVSAARGAVPAPNLNLAETGPLSSDRLELAVIGATAPGMAIQTRLGIETHNGNGFVAALAFAIGRDQAQVIDQTFEIASYQLTARGGYRFQWTIERFGAWIAAEAAAGMTLQTGLPFVVGGWQFQPIVGIGPRVGFFFEPTPHLRLGVMGEALAGAPVSQVGIGFGVSWAP